MVKRREKGGSSLVRNTGPDIILLSHREKLAAEIGLSLDDLNDIVDPETREGCSAEEIARVNEWEASRSLAV